MWLVCIWNAGVAIPTRSFIRSKGSCSTSDFYVTLVRRMLEKAWRDAFDQNCKAPCFLDPRDVERFLAAVPSVHKGDDCTLLFTSKGVHVTINGWPLGDVADPHFAELMLATFIGSVPPTPRLKRELLGLLD